MVPTEKQIISKMKKLMKLDYESEKPKVEDLITWANNTLHLIKLFLPSNSIQIQTLEKSLNEFLTYEVYYADRQNKMFVTFKGVLSAIYSDYNEGFLKDLRTEIRAEADADFLSQAHRLLEEKLKDSAAMLTGAVLEDALRQLCIKYGVKEGSNIESMNVPLRKAGAYGLPAQQQVTAWAAIRNKADHARFKEYDIKEARLMHQGVNDFVAKHLT